MKRSTITVFSVLQRIANSPKVINGNWKAAKYAVLAVSLVVLAAACQGRYKSRLSPPKIIQLPEPEQTGTLTLEQALAERRSVRQFTNQQLGFEQIGQLAWAGQGITDRQRGFRTAPSAGAIYPIKLYFATQQGLFVYHPDKHSLEEIFSEDIRSRLATAALKQQAVSNAPCDIIIAGSVRDLAAKYGKKARRYMLLEAGHIAQNIQLQSVSLELGSVPVGAFDITGVRKLCRLPMSLEPIYIICAGYPVGQPATKKSEKETPSPEPEHTGVKKAVLIVANENFRDEELFETRHVLDQAGIQTVIASTKMTELRGMLGGRAKATLLVSKISVDDYDAIIFIGGLGARQYFNSRVALNIAREAVNKGKVLGAICIAPAILANAGVLGGIKATGFPSERPRLIRAGAKYTAAAVEQDGLIITAAGPQDATQFGKAITETLTVK